MESISDLSALEELIRREKALLLYFSTTSCSVCKVLKPKVSELVRGKFPELATRYVDSEQSPLIAGQFRVFAVPTLVLFFAGSEQARHSRNISLHQLEQAIDRPYQLLFGPGQ